MPEIKFRVRNLDIVQAYINALPKNLRGIATKAMAEWFVGNGQRGLRHYPPYKYVTRKSAYGQTFKSDKQRRKVMAMIRSGEIDPGFPHRTGNYQRGWQIENDRTRTRITNSVPYASYVGGDDMQANLNKKVGWRTFSEILSTNIAGAIRHANSKIKEWIGR